MKKILAAPVMIFFLFFFIFLPANAQNALIEEDIERYLATLPKIQSLNTAAQPSGDSSNMPPMEDQNDQLTTRTPISDNLTRMKDHPSFDRFSEIVIEQGFQNPAMWAAVGDKIMLAYSAYLINNPESRDAPTLDEMKQELIEQRTKIEANQFITPEHKELLLNKIENSMEMLSDPNYIASENISVIRPYIGRLNSYLRNSNDTY